MRSHLPNKKARAEAPAKASSPWWTDRPDGAETLVSMSGGLVVEAAGRFALVGLAAVDAVAGIAGSAFDLGLLPLRYFGMQVTQCLAVGPADILVFAGDDRSDPGLRAADTAAQFDLRHAMGANFGDERLPVHAAIIIILLFGVNGFMVAFSLKIP